jgi:cyclopropane fatty-acyl-phospholipid synthase-like methyltransferase
VTTVAQERAFWDAADPVCDIGGGGDWQHNVDAALAALEVGLRIVPGSRVCEIGCGPGRLLLPLARRHPEASFVGVDVSATMLARLAVADPPGNVSWTQAARSFPDAGFDSVYAVCVFQHLGDRAVKNYIAQAGESLEPGGRLRFQFVAGDRAAPFDVARPISRMLGWCRGFEIVDVTSGLISDDWVWVTAVKP